MILVNREGAFPPIGEEIYKILVGRRKSFLPVTDFYGQKIF